MQSGDSVTSRPRSRVKTTTRHAVPAADCCRTTRRGIDSVNCNGAIDTAAIRQTVTEQTRKVLDTVTGNRMADMQNQIDQLQPSQALCGVVRYPNTFAYNAGPSPFCGDGCCGTANI